MKVLITDPISKSGLNLIKESGFDVIFEDNLNNNDLGKIISNIDAWIVRSGTQVEKEFICKAKKLKVIGRAGVGIDNIDIEAATLNGVLVMNTPDGNTISAAEHTIAMMCTLARNIQIAHSDLIKGMWNRHAFVGIELRGKILGVVGLGRIGLEVAQRALAFGMEIIGYDPYVNDTVLKEYNILKCDLDELTAKSDFITLHIPLIDSTKKIFDINRLSRMKKNARIINVARGGLIDEKDLVHALNNDIIVGAAIDVFEKEPLDQNSPLLKAKNILLTPHLGASTIEAKEGVSISICQQIVDFLKYEKMGNAINMPITDMNILKNISPYIMLAETIGKIQIQLSTSPIKSISIDCYGLIEESKTILLSFIKGLLYNILEGRINFINADAIAKERGIKTSHSYKSKDTPFSNLIMTKIETDNEIINVGGSVFGENHIRIVDIMGFELDVRPEGDMLFMKNQDIPGVIGKVGSILGNAGINIGEYLLSRTSQNDIAYAVVKLDCKLNDNILENLNELDEVLNIHQLKL